MENTVAEGVALERFTSAGGDHGAEAGPDNVKDQAHDGKGWVELDDGLFAASDGLVSFLLGAHSNFQILSIIILIDTPILAFEN